jgi:hypothetical protein
VQSSQALHTPCAARLHWPGLDHLTSCTLHSAFCILHSALQLRLRSLLGGETGAALAEGGQNSRGGHCIAWALRREMERPRSVD